METKNYTYEKVPFNEKRPSFYENDTYQSTTKSANSSNKTFLFIVAIIGNLISFSVGTAMSWPSSELDKLNSTFTISLDEGSWVSSLFHLGGVFGPFLFGYLADRIGRKPTITMIGIPLTISFFLMALVKHLYVFYFSRFISGISAGGVFTVMPMYVGEIADSKNRGALAGLLNLAITSGVLFSYVLGPYVSLLVFNLVLAVFPLISMPLFYFLAYESPRYLMAKNSADGDANAMVLLRQMRGGSVDVEEELDTIRQAIKDEGDASIKHLFTSCINIRIFGVIAGLLMFQQFSGINAVYSYSANIFALAGTSVSPAVCAIILGIVQVFSSFLSTALTDRLGRKLLLVISGIGMVLSEALLGFYSYLKDQLDMDLSSAAILPLVCLLVYIVTYNVGCGSIPWTIMGEVFPTNIKSIASSLCASLSWILAFLIVRYFQNMADSIGLGPSFLVFSLFCAAYIFFTLIFVRETKGKTLEEIQREMKR